MAAQFDGVNLIVTLDAPTAGVLNQTWEQVYDDAKQWHLNALERKYPFPFLTSGGEQITPTTIAGQYYFFRNDLGWRIETTDESQDVFWEGNGIPNDLTQRILNTMPGRTVGHFGLQPLVTGLTGIEDLTAAAIFAWSVETGFNFEQILRLLSSNAAGKIVQALNGVYQIRDLNDLKDRIEGDDAANGGRDITALDPD